MSWHIDPKITIAQIGTLLFLVFAAGGAYYQIGQLADAMHRTVSTIERQGDRITQVESRTAVLEMQRVEDHRRLDEIREDVRFIRDRLEGAK